MVQKARSPGNTQVSISLSDELLSRIDERAASLGLSRSIYLASLARKDITDGGALTLNELAANIRAVEAKKSSNPNLPKDIYDKVVQGVEKIVKYPPASRRKSQP